MEDIEHDIPGVSAMLTEAISRLTADGRFTLTSTAGEAVVLEDTVTGFVIGLIA
jgi:hypothetical protein